MEKESRNTPVGVGEEENPRTADENTTGGNPPTARKESGKRGNNTDAGNNGNRGNKNTEEGKEKIPCVVTVNVPEVTEEKPKKKRAPKQTKKEKQNASIDLLTGLICGGSDMVALVPNCGHWSITEEEGRTIAEPLAKVIEKNEHLQKVMEQSDSIALVLACVSVFVPRMYMSYTIMQEKKKKKEVLKNESRESERGNQPPVEKPSADHAGNVQTLFNSIDV